ncbi:group 3 secretory phospholipase A2 isoform X2 [Dunckerocampus dactyliophorus]|uniref:group 3 secretory phospholipase A2 isoform X2 n=1 Tax=Dunckerocampus dactyliophorus TaxID=161453 RepID=UPI0024073C6C|nr:group 3 secretory phospholipase A2 isoform X2 [Dunckerocampus dactyliophorus]
MTRAIALLVLTSSLLRWTMAGESRSPCARATLLPGGGVHVTFVSSAPAPARLYHSAWSRERALLACAWTDGAEAVREHVSACERERHQLLRPPPRALVEAVLSRADACVSPRVSRWSPEVKGHQRVKRGFIVPGTLWCGSGNKAPSYDDLGVFSDTDSCCREHDQCKHTILSFHSQFGVFNSNIFTMSHCDCDSKFRHCLQEAKDGMADVVGYTFFNLLSMHCFSLSHRLQCAQRNWFGMCKESKMALYAEVHPPTLYQSTSATAPSVNISNVSLLMEDMPSAMMSLTTPPSASRLPAVSFPAPDNTSRRQADLLGQNGSCSAFKILDECREKIPPKMTRFGLFNSESKTVYHCSCTSRTFHTLTQQHQPLTPVQNILLDLMSQSCFLQKNCTRDQTCGSPAVLLEAELPRLRSSADAEEQRRLEAVLEKVRRSRRRQGEVKVHKVCVRMLRHRVNTAGTHT